MATKKLAWYQQFAKADLILINNCYIYKDSSYQRIKPNTLIKKDTSFWYNQEHISYFVTVCNIGMHYINNESFSIKVVPKTKDLPATEIIVTYNLLKQENFTTEYTKVTPTENNGYLFYNENYYQPTDEKLLRYIPKGGAATEDYVIGRITIRDTLVTMENNLRSHFITTCGTEICHITNKSFSIEVVPKTKDLPPTEITVTYNSLKQENFTTEYTKVTLEENKGYLVYNGNYYQPAEKRLLRYIPKGGAATADYVIGRITIQDMVAFFEGEHIF